MSEYAYTPQQNVSLNQAAIFEVVTPCMNGAVTFENGTGVFVIQGVVDCPYQYGTEYNIAFNGNIAIPEGGTASTPIAVGIAVNGEVRPASVAIVTPAAAEQFFNVTSIATVYVPRGRTYTVSLRAVAPPSDLTATPAASVDLRAANIRITGRVV